MEASICCASRSRMLRCSPYDLYGCASRFDLEALATMDDGCAMLTVLQRVSNSNAAMFDLNFLPAERR
ncbi:hypothetical protein ACUXVY_19210 [Chromobacterium haemolyticum]|uniref:hypothetical protein n=1 Tax=Chromobacterium haemolyticum TaxID=394935 RepID=UPI004055CD16